MLNFIKNNVLMPVATRLGMFTTGALVGVGANAAHADWVGTGVAGLFLIGMDLGLAELRKRAIVNKTFKQVMGILWPHDDEPGVSPTPGALSERVERAFRTVVK